MRNVGRLARCSYRGLILSIAVLGLLLIPEWWMPALGGARADGSGRCRAAHFGYRTLRRGATGEDVWHLQSVLSKMGLFHGETTGFFGSKTAASLRAFQSSRGFRRTGVAAGETLATLRQIVAMLEWNEYGYEVGEGDTLGAISQAYDIPAKVLAMLNGLDENVTLTPGDRIIIPVPEFTMHEVQKGETLAGIAREYGVGWRALAGWNGIKHPHVIYPGEMLVIPVAPLNGDGSPPADSPPADSPLVDSPPAGSPPADSLPADSPPADSPPANSPPQYSLLQEQKVHNGVDDPSSP